jgi:hypothetical protein
MKSCRSGAGAAVRWQAACRPVRANRQRRDEGGDVQSGVRHCLHSIEQYNKQFIMSFGCWELQRAITYTVGQLSTKGEDVCAVEASSTQS